mmetsp:Transcript_22465/g.27660  ORF Transcript_22465/g.27660 Transcript_22465/m.27660 type:complete len:225 (+) Transcript_22465:320-994(+)
MLNKESSLQLEVHETVESGLPRGCGGNGALFTKLHLTSIERSPLRKLRGHHRIPRGPLRKFTLQADGATRWDFEGQHRGIFNGARLHTLQNSLLLLHLLHDDALKFVGHINHHFLVRLLFGSSFRILTQQDFGRRNHELKALAAHVLHQNAQLQGATALDFEALRGAAGIHADGQVGEAFLFQASLELRCSDLGRLLALAGKGRFVDGKLHGHRGFLDLDGWQR